MIIDYNCKLSAQQSDVTTVAVWPSTNVIDLTQTTNRVIGNGLWMICRVVAAFTTAASGTVTFRMVTSAAVGLTAPTIYYDSGALACATLIAHYLVFALRIPDKLALQYLGATYEVITGTVADGTIDTIIVPGKELPSIL